MTSTENKKQQDIEIFFENGESVIFPDFVGHQVGNTWVAVMTKDGRTTLYKVENIDYVIIHTKE